MADQFNLNQLLGGGLPAGLLSPEQEAAAQQRAQAAGLLNFAFGALQASRGAPGQGRPSLGQIIGQAGPVGVAGYQQSFENTLANALRGMQFQRFAEAQKRDIAGREALRQFSEKISGVTPQGALAAPGGAAGPTVERASAIGQRQPMTAQDILALASNPDISEETRKNILSMAELVTPKATQGMLGQFREALRGGEIPPGTTFENFMRMVEKPPATVQIMPAESATQTGYAKFGVERNTAIFDAGQAAIRNLPKIDQTINLIKEGDAKTGFGAEVINNINRVRAAFTGSKKQIQSVSDTELLDSLLGSEVFPQIGALGIGAKGLDTPAEREFLRKVMTGTITMDKQTLIRMAELRRKYEKRSLDTYNDAVDSGQLNQLFRYSGLPKRKLQVPLQVNY
jgi:hypothetical protein